MISESTEKIVRCLALLGFFAFSIGFVFFAIRVLQSYDAPWEVQVMVVGILLLLLACAGAKLVSK
jgi:membrane protein implicated in regulation of membrane protease activity